MNFHRLSHSHELQLTQTHRDRKIYTEKKKYIYIYTARLEQETTHGQF